MGNVEFTTMEVRIPVHMGFVRSDCRLDRMVEGMDGWIKKISEFNQIHQLMPSYEGNEVKQTSRES